MKIGTGTIIEILQRTKNSYQALIRLEGLQQPTAGQYLSAHRTKDRDKPVGFTIFPGGIQTGFLPEDHLLTSVGIPPEWQPGDRLNLRGPLGQGFNIPQETTRLALCSIGDSSDHLLPLAAEVLSRRGEVALFTDGDFSSLPTRIEVNKLEDLKEACRWADMLACAIPVDFVEDSLDHLSNLSPIRCPTQVLIAGQFPCSGLAECSICAIRPPRGKIKLPCQDGPVFDWNQLV
jgi:hypothetical protein